MRNLLVLLVIAFLALPALPAGAAELAGVTLDDSTEAGGNRLVLNGLGLRKKAIFKVYVGGLYLPAKQSDADKILAADSARRVVMAFVRSVGAGSLTGAWDDCLAANTPNAGAELKKQFGELNGWMEDVESGDRLTFTYAPGSGTEVDVKGKSKGTLSGKTFADALFACWIGPTPPSEDFKDGLLGK